MYLSLQSQMSSLPVLIHVKPEGDMFCIVTVSYNPGLDVPDWHDTEIKTKFYQIPKFQCM